eukprot:403338699
MTSQTSKHNNSAQIKEQNSSEFQQQSFEQSNRSTDTFHYVRGMLIFSESNVRNMFILDQTNGVLYLFKQSNQSRPFKKLFLPGGQMLEQQRLISDQITGDLIPSFDYKLCRVRSQKSQIITVFSENNLDIERLKENFTSCSLLSPVLDIEQPGSNKLSRGLLSVAKAPIKATQLLIISLERLGDGARVTPFYLSGQNYKDSQQKLLDRVDVSHLIDGLAKGAQSMIKEIVGAVAGIVMEPIKGAKLKGIKGGAKGLGKGMLGLICKPVAGSIDLVTYTSRGIGRTPKTIQQRIKTIIRKRRMHKKLLNLSKQQQLRQSMGSVAEIKPYIPSNEEVSTQEILKKQRADKQLKSRRQQQQNKNLENFIIGQSNKYEYSINSKHLIKLLQQDFAQNHDMNADLFDDISNTDKIIDLVKIELSKFLQRNTEEITASTLINKLVKIIKTSLNQYSPNQLDKGIVSLLQIDEDDEYSSESQSDQKEYKIDKNLVQGYECLIQDMVRLLNEDNLQLSKKRIHGLQEEEFDQIHEIEKSESGDGNESDLKTYLLQEKLKNQNYDIYMIEAQPVVDDSDEEEEKQSQSNIDKQQRLPQSQRSSFSQLSNKHPYELDNSLEDDDFYSARESLDKSKASSIFDFLTYHQLKKDNHKENLIQYLLMRCLIKNFPALHKIQDLQKLTINELIQMEEDLCEIVYQQIEQQAQVRVQMQQIASSMIKSQNQSFSNKMKNSDEIIQGKQIHSKVNFGQDVDDQKLKRQKKIIDIAKTLKKINRSDEYRSSDAHKNGGFALNDQKVIQKYRNAGKELIKQIGKQLITGNFNLTNTSFPIKCMSHKSILEVIATVSCVGPAYLNAAAFATDPVERLKYVMTASIAWMYPTHHWDKPLNPVLGETYQAELPDGSQVYLEQSCHKPPISHVLLEGPEEIYQFSGYSGFSAKAYLNSIALNVFGSKVVKFKDGTVIKYNNPCDAFNNTFFGILNHQICGKVEFIDEKNGLRAFYDIGNVKKKTQDYFVGEIYQNERKVSDIKGNYMGFMDFDGIRYWDLRDQIIYESQGKPLVLCLPTDSRIRIDSQALLGGDVEQAQRNKESLEHLQRSDRTNRENAEKRRAKGGPKYIYKQ